MNKYNHLSGAIHGRCAAAPLISVRLFLAAVLAIRERGTDIDYSWNQRLRGEPGKVCKEALVFSPHSSWIAGSIASLRLGRTWGAMQHPGARRSAEDCDYGLNSLQVAAEPCVGCLGAPRKAGCSSRVSGKRTSWQAYFMLQHALQDSEGTQVKAESSTTKDTLLGRALRDR